MPAIEASAPEPVGQTLRRRTASVRGPTHGPTGCAERRGDKVRTAFAPGRVNLIGDHTDYTGGWALPMAIHLGTTVTCEVGADAMAGTDLVVASADFGTAVIGPGRTTERWARYVAAVAEEIDRRPRSARLTVQTTVPIGAGLSSSAALEVSVALAL